MSIDQNYKEAERTVKTLQENKHLKQLLDQFMSCYCIFGFDTNGTQIMFRKENSDMELLALINSVPDVAMFLNEPFNGDDEDEY